LGGYFSSSLLATSQALFLFLPHLLLLKPFSSYILLFFLFL
jgi:hypothetical protein